MVLFSEQFFGRINLWKGMAFCGGKLAKPTDDGCVGNVPAIPSEQDIHAVNGSERNVSGVAIRIDGEKS
jgi:hypothetical protein